MCIRDSLTFTALPVNGGSAPKYQWFLNGLPVTGATKSVFTTALNKMDAIKCQMTSNADCVLGPVVFSDTFTGSAPFITGPATVFKGSCTRTYYTDSGMTG